MRKTNVFQGVARALILPERFAARPWTNWPVCQQCGEDVDAVHIVDEGNRFGLRYVVLQAEHHGKFDAVRIEFNSAYPTKSDFDAAYAASTFFEKDHTDSGFSQVK